MIDAGRGLGMGRGQLFVHVQFPLALPVVLEGVRTASVQAVGNTVVAALIGAGGLGSLVFPGLGAIRPRPHLAGNAAGCCPGAGTGFAVVWSLESADPEGENLTITLTTFEWNMGLMWPSRGCR